MSIFKKRKPIVGYTTGVYDLFHVGHLNILRNAKNFCDKLIVGVTSDELVAYKHKKAVISFEERMEIVRAIRHVDVVVGQFDMNKMAAWERYKFDVMFVGDDWYKTEKWNELEEQFKTMGVKIIYFPYTRGISSTLINEVLERTREELIQKGEVAKQLLSELAVKTKNDKEVGPLVAKYLEHISLPHAADHQ